MELLLKINIYEIIIVAIAVSFIVEGIGYVFRTVKRRVLLPAVSLGITVLRIFPLESIEFSNPSAMIFNLLLTVSFAILFYKYGGERVVKFITGSIATRIENTTKAKENEPFE